MFCVWTLPREDGTGWFGRLGQFGTETSSYMTGSEVSGLLNKPSNLWKLDTHMRN